MSGGRKDTVDAVAIFLLGRESQGDQIGDRMAKQKKTAPICNL